MLKEIFFVFFFRFRTASPEPSSSPGPGSSAWPLSLALTVLLAARAPPTTPTTSAIEITPTIAAVNPLRLCMCPLSCWLTRCASRSTFATTGRVASPGPPTPAARRLRGSGAKARQPRPLETLFDRQRALHASLAMPIDAAPVGVLARLDRGLSPDGPPPDRLRARRCRFGRPL